MSGPGEISDVELVQRAGQGDAVAAAAIFEKYWPFALSVARRFGAGDHAEDIAAEVLGIWLMTGRWRLKPRHVSRSRTLKPFVATLIRFACMQYLWARHAEIEIAEDFERDDERRQVRRVRDLRPSPEDVVLARERRRHVIRSFAELPAYLLRVAKLRYVRHWSGPAIARAVRTRPETVPGYLYQTRLRLREALRPFYGARVDPHGRRGYQRFDGGRYRRASRCR